MTPKAERLSDAVTLYEGDCLEVMATLPGVDAVICDPPYGINHSTAHGASWAGTMIAGDSNTLIRDAVIAFAESRRMPWAIFGTWKMKRPENCRGVLVWDKGPAFGMGDLSFPWKASWEEIYIGGKGWEGHRDEGVIRGHLTVSWESKGRVHPHQKPVSLLRYLIRKLPTATTIFDPCSGSGPLLVAAQLEGRHAIGCEIDPHYCDIIRRRVREADGAAPGTLFREVARRESLFADEPEPEVAR